MKTQLTAEQEKDTAKISEAMEFCVSEDESSFVYLVATAKDPGMNGIQRMENRGKVVGTLVYDQVRDHYNVMALAVHKVGTIPISYIMRLKGNTSWHTHVPMPEDVILQYLSSKQKFGIDKFKEKMEGCDFHYIHFTGYF